MGVSAAQCLQPHRDSAAGRKNIKKCYCIQVIIHYHTGLLKEQCHSTTHTLELHISDLDKMANIWQKALYNTFCGMEIIIQSFYLNFTEFVPDAATD